MDHYEEFAKELATAMGQSHPDVCFYTYGSFARKEHDARKGSDIDGGFIFPGGVVLPQDRVIALGDIIQEVHNRHKVKLQLNLLDVATGVDGRFLSYSDDFVDDINGTGMILAGPDLRSSLRGLNYKHSSLNGAAFDLRKARNFLLFAADNYRLDPKMFGRKAHSVISAAVKFPKKIVLLRGNRLLTKASDARNSLRDMLERDMRDFEQLERFATVSERDLARNYQLGLSMYCGAVSAVEGVVQAYIDKFPQLDEREARFTS